MIFEVGSYSKETLKSLLTWATSFAVGQRVKNSAMVSIGEVEDGVTKASCWGAQAEATITAKITMTSLNALRIPPVV